jgi:hypothetical protein
MPKVWLMQRYNKQRFSLCPNTWTCLTTYNTLPRIPRVSETVHFCFLGSTQGSRIYYCDSTRKSILDYRQQYLSIISFQLLQILQASQPLVRCHPPTLVTKHPLHLDTPAPHTSQSQQDYKITKEDHRWTFPSTYLIDYPPFPRKRDYRLSRPGHSVTCRSHPILRGCLIPSFSTARARRYKPAYLLC